MTVLPVIERELRAEARHAFTYWLRALGATVLLIIFAVMMIDQSENAPRLGAKLFGNLHTALFIAIWLLVPLLTADCLSRERREGTGILVAAFAFLDQTGLRDRGYGPSVSEFESAVDVAVLVACTFGTLPVVGLYFSLARKHFLAAWLTTVSIGLALPLMVVIGALFDLFPLPAPYRLYGISFNEFAMLTGALQIISVLLFSLLLHRSLHHRKFALAS
jgi:hypothetical protein